MVSVPVGVIVALNQLAASLSPYTQRRQPSCRERAGELLGAGGTVSSVLAGAAAAGRLEVFDLFAAGVPLAEPVLIRVFDGVDALALLVAVFEVAPFVGCFPVDERAGGVGCIFASCLGPGLTAPQSLFRHLATHPERGPDPNRIVCFVPQLMQVKLHRGPKAI